MSADAQQKHFRDRCQARAGAVADLPVMAVAIAKKTRVRKKKAVRVRFLPYEVFREQRQHMTDEQVFLWYLKKKTKHD